MKKMYIYKITCLTNGKIYIGYTTSTIEERFYKHKFDSGNGSAFALHRAMRKYGIENFTIKQVCVCFDIDSLKRIETFFIRKLKSKEPKNQR